MAMVSLALVWPKVEISAQELELICPQGWIAFNVAKYSCGYLSTSQQWWTDYGADCLLCLTCQRSSTSANGQEKIEQCWITLPTVAFHMDLMKPHQFQAQNWNFPEITELIQQKQLCGISALYSQKLDKVVTKACDQQQKDKGSETTDLICPRSFFLVSRFKVKNADQEKSLCIHCQSYKTFNIVPARIFMCYTGITRKMAVNKFHPSPMEDCKNTPTTFQVGTQIFCGMKIRPLDYENFSECVLCQSEKDQHGAVRSIKYVFCSQNTYTTICFYSSPTNNNSAYSWCGKDFLYSSNENLNHTIYRNWLIPFLMPGYF